jgi:serine protease Do
MAMTAADLRAALSEAARTAAATAGPATVRIGRHGGRGCGVVLGDGAVLTNAHNLRDRTTEVTFQGGRTAQGEVRAADVDGDLAVLDVDTAGAPALVWAEEPPQLGTLAYAAAATPDGATRVTVGMLSSVDGTFRGPRGRRVSGALEHTAPLMRGSSGSPLLDEGGSLLGVNTARLGQGFYVALPADAELRGRVDALLRREVPTPRVLGVGLAPGEVSARLRASVGLPPRDGLLVRAVDPAGRAAAAGIQVGDLVAGAAGAAVATVDDLHRALDEAGPFLELHLVRGTEDVPVLVTLEP